ncbi:Hypothetical protein PSEBR_m1642 [Pseudomonas brassicacearum subsp. brassicacearum NFM421]|uniref:Uncharacterized protein n=1 Tax=Pseudomonas brassicacearum (strain NFM421) TaxID=994484 RepID=F2K5Y2_PSEBN|nr:Hypothetical protein PSEBR_m1642 [Pseudomonas brassicacearum subsp. brassicacearum NFM421]
MGASLLAIAVDQSTFMLDLSPSSRASSLPQGSSKTSRFLCLQDLRSLGASPC